MKDDKKQAPRGKEMDHQSTMFIKHLFETRQSEATQFGRAFDMPMWYNQSRPSTTAGDRYSMFLFKSDDDDNDPTKGLAAEPLIPVKVPSQTLKDKVDTALRGCVQDEVHEVVLDGKPFEQNSDVPADPEDSTRWVCKEKKERLAKLDLPMSVRERLLKKLDEATNLLVERFEAEGEYPMSEWQQCNPTLKYGIDLSPTPSQCVMTRRQSDYVEDPPGTDERTKAYAETPTPTPPQDKTRRGKASLYCPIMDLTVESYVKEPTAELLLTKIAALNAQGELTCELKELNDVEHFLRKVLVKWAKEVEAKEAEEKSRKHEVSFLPPEEPEKDLYTHLRKALNAEIHKENFRKDRTRTLPSLLEGYKLSERVHKSLAAEKVEEVLGRLLRAMSVMEGTNKPDLKQLKASIYEILPFELNDELFETGDLFDEDNQNSLIQSMFRKKSMKSKSEKISWPVDSAIREEHLLEVRECVPDCDVFQAQKLNFFQWQNRHLVEEMKDVKGLSGDEEELLSIIKHFSHWLDVVRKARILKNVCCTVERTKIFEGPWPKHALELIRSFEQDPDYFPSSRKEYHKKLRLAKERVDAKIAAMLEDYSSSDAAEE